MMARKFVKSRDVAREGAAAGVRRADRRTSAVWVALAWVVVGAPMAWGVEETVKKSMDLFRPPEVQSGAGTQPAPAPTAPEARPQPTTPPGVGGSEKG